MEMTNVTPYHQFGASWYASMSFTCGSVGSFGRLSEAWRQNAQFQRRGSAFFLRFEGEVKDQADLISS
jgi:hypothetical protein